MKISHTWLKRHIELNESPEEISKLLTDCGLEVEKLEKFESIKGGLEGFVVGEVISCEKHPGADKLKKTTVDVGNGTILPIVCGAPNVAIGQKVIVATVGTTIYPSEGEPFKINKAKIRGEVSEGMICAEDEIGIGKSHDGILVLKTDLLNGTPASKYFKLESDYIYEIGLTPNRGDAASHQGVARDLKAVLRRSLIALSNHNFHVPSDPTNVEVVVENTRDCIRYAGISMSNIEVKDSPEWLKQALKSIGMNPINNIVDITNFILHDLGQPLHAFDLDKLSEKKIIVGNVSENTPFTTLDGITRKISGEDLMISDGEKPVAIAGVFGGLDSGVTAATKNIFIESACFSANAVRKTSLRHSLKTEASFRFERGTDPNLPVVALHKAISLIQEICGGKIASAIIDQYPVPVNDQHLTLSLSRIQNLIGQKISKDTVSDILQHLDIKTTHTGADVFEVFIPPYRVDVKRHADVVEEILRIYGLNNILLSDRVSSAYVAEFPKKDAGKIQQMVSESLVPLGFYEIITNSLTKSAYASMLESNNSVVKILNPLSEVLDAMRQTLVFSGLEVLSHNINRQKKDLKIFEYGKIYNKYPSGYTEQNRFNVMVTGDIQGESFAATSRETDIEYLKMTVDLLLRRLGVSKFQFEPSENLLFNESLVVKVKGKTLASLGSVKPQFLKLFDIRQKVYLADLDADLLLDLFNDGVLFKEIPKFPEVRRDLSLVLDQQITFRQINELAFKIERKLLKDLNVFDVYQGDKIEAGKKSYSVSFILQDPDQTLTDKVIDQTMKKLMDSFEKELGAVIRSKN